MKKIGMMVLFSLFLLAMPVPAWGASTELAPYLEDLDMEQIDAAAENAVEDVTFSELVEDVLTGDFSFSMEDLWEKLGEVAFGELRTQTGLIMQLIAVSILAAVLRQDEQLFQPERHASRFARPRLRDQPEPDALPVLFQHTAVRIRAGTHHLFKSLFVISRGDGMQDGGRIVKLCGKAEKIIPVPLLYSAYHKNNLLSLFPGKNVVCPGSAGRPCGRPAGIK